MATHQDPGLPGAEQARTHAGAERPGPAEAPTVRLGGTAPASGESGDEPTRATVLDPDVWDSTLHLTADPRETESTLPHPAPSGPTPSAGSPATGEVRRFGPGVSVPAGTADTGQAAAVWHGTVRPGQPSEAGSGTGPRRRRALRGWLLPVAVLIGVLAYLAWRHYPAPVTVTGVDVRSDAAVQGCGSTARIVGVVRTSGGSGTIGYRWRRSDGTVSDEVRQHVAKGTQQTEVVLLWTFSGHGSLKASAVLEVLSPQRQSASTAFAYRCR